MQKWIADLVIFTREILNEKFHFFTVVIQLSIIVSLMYDFYCVQWFVLCSVICTTFNELHYFEWLLLHWMISITWYDLYYAKWYVIYLMFCTNICWKICNALNDSSYVSRIWTASKDFNKLNNASNVVLF